MKSMKERQEIDLITELLGKWLIKIKMNTALTYYDINKLSENLSLKLLNILYGFELKNLNNTRANYCGIDLGDSTKTKIAFQVTSSTDLSKIRSTLEKFVERGYYKTYINGVRFLILRDEELKIDKNKFQSIYENFDADKHIITYKDLIRDICNLYTEDFNKFSRIKNLLMEELGSVNSNEIVEKQNIARRVNWFPRYRGILIKVFFLFIVLFPILYSMFYNKPILSEFLIPLKANFIALLAFFSIVLTLFILLKISDNKFKKQEKEHYPEFESFKSKEETPIKTKVSKDNRKDKQEVTIYNSGREKIDYIKGRVLFYDNNVEIEGAEFEEYNIEPLKGKKVFSKRYNSDDSFEKMHWNEFNTYIDEVKIHGEIERDIKLHGNHFIRTYFLLLNKYKYFRLGKFRVLPYEISWLKENVWLWTIKPWFFNGHNIPRLISFSGERKEPTSYFFIRLYKKVIRLVILIFVAFYLYIALKAIGLVLLNIGRLWLEILSMFLV